MLSPWKARSYPKSRPLGLTNPAAMKNPLLANVVSTEPSRLYRAIERAPSMVRAGENLVVLDDDVEEFRLVPCRPDDGAAGKRISGGRVVVAAVVERAVGIETLEDELLPAGSVGLMAGKDDFPVRLDGNRFGDETGGCRE